MCRKLGKGHPNYVDQTHAIRDQDGKVFRACNGRPITEGYTHRILKTFLDLSHKYQIIDQVQDRIARPKPAKLRRLTRLDNLWCYRSTKRPNYDKAYSLARLDHLARNHVRHTENDLF